MGRDSSGGLCYAKLPCFNPRARMGRDVRGLAHGLGRSRFNPRARMGRDKA